MDKKEFEKFVDDFVKDYQKNNYFNEFIKSEILKNSTAWNKENVMEDLIKRIDEHRLYEEDGFPYLIYVEKFLSSIPKAINTIKEVDFSIDK